MDCREKIKSLPIKPGVYIMKGRGGEVLYVGKAANLRKRVSSYFYPNRKSSERLSAMIGKIDDITYIPASTEAEALIYENSLIKQLSPRYNVALRDDKSYPMLKLTAQESFPRLFITRRKIRDGSIYYGPYADAKLLRKALLILRQLFPLRSCAKLPKKVCLNYHIKQCLGPCEGKITETEYGEMVGELKLFLEARRSELMRLLTEKMVAASRREEFEEAGRIKKRIDVLSAVKESAIRYMPAGEIEELKSVLGLEGPLDTIEAFDISNIMGTEAVGSMVCFYKGRPRKSDYRKFRIETVSRVDDYGMMREVMRRRYARLLREKSRLPDLILIDGGRGHLNAALGELRRMGLSDIRAIGIAKEFEHIYIEGKEDPLVLPRESKALHLLERIRDEAHRFAISYHKSLRSKKMSYSEIDDIPGIGRKRKSALMHYFKTVDKIKTASIDELLKVEGMNEKSARSIIGYFKR